MNAILQLELIDYTP